MPDTHQHLRKYNSNKNLLNSQEMNPETTEHCDWVIIVAFYSAIHLIEKVLAENDSHTHNHLQRLDRIEQDEKFKKIRAKYNALWNKSSIARYKARIANTEQATKMVEYLKAIEDELLTQFDYSELSKWSKTS